MLHKMPIYENNRELGRSPFGGRVVELHQLMGKAAQCWSATCRSISFEPAKPTDSLLPILLSTPDTPETPETPDTPDTPISSQATACHPSPKVLP